MAFEKFPALHELQSRHGVSIGSTYVKPQSAKLFTHYIAFAQREGFISSQICDQGFEKTRLPHTSNFMTLVNHNLLCQ